ncbi:MAG: hypothetical protein JWO78_2194 [Micavibrio sp.]|nr:hypothetical protein [Micavibrio sp.]
MKRSDPTQYPQQTGPYSVRVKTGANWQNYSTCRLQISVGQAYHEGAKFEATINWVKERFDSVIICVNDTLQRHNTLFMDGGDDDTVARRWSCEGANWIARHKDLLATLEDCTVYKWDAWRNQENYTSIREQVDHFYETNDLFHNAINANIQTFWDRNAISYEDRHELDFTKFARHSLRYLLEETAVFSIMFDQIEAVDIYPGTVLLPAFLFRGNPVPGMPEGLDKGAFTRIDFKRNSAKALSDNQDALSQFSSGKNN